MNRSFPPLLAIGLLTLSPSSAPDTVHLIFTQGIATTTPVSGSRSSEVTSRSPGRDAFLWGLSLDEKGDKPCFIQAHWWRFNTKPKEEFTTQFDICKGKTNPDKVLKFTSKDIDLPAVDSVQVCQASDSNPRLKGVVLTAAAIDRDGLVEVEPQMLSRSFERTNCSKWRKKRSCPTGQVAIGLDIHHDDEEITGLALTCIAPLIGSATATQAPELTSAERYEHFENDIQVKVDENGRTKVLSMDEAIEQHEVNGVSIVMLNGGKIEREHHYGVRSRKTEAPVNENTIYQTASMSKLPAAIAMLIAARTSHGPKLQRTIDKSAAQFPDTLFGRWVKKQFKGRIESGFPEDITVERLISNTAGLDTHGIGTAKSDSPTTLKTILLGKVGNPGVKPLAAPGTKWAYSGGGFSAAEAMLEAHSGDTARRFLIDNVLGPFGMSKSTYRDASDDMPNLARGCSRGTCSDKPWHSEAKFAGGLLANPREYAHLLQVLLHEGRDPTDGGRQVLETADVERLFTPIGHRDSSRKACAVHADCRDTERCYEARCLQPLDAWGSWYGLGVFLKPDADYDGLPRFVEHGGANDHARTLFKIDRQTKDGVVILIAGVESWTRKKVKYGADALLDDIEASYDRHYD